MLKRFINDIKKYFRYSIVSATAQLKSEVADSYLNWIWWILDPLSFMLIYTFIFGYVFKAREEHFSVFIFIGLSMWRFFEKTVKQSVKLVKNNKSIVAKVYIPKFILILTKIWVNAFKMLVSFGIVVLMIIVCRIPISWNVIYIVPILVVLMLLTFGCSTFFMHYGVYVQDLSNITNIILKLLFYITGIFYNVETRIPGAGKIFNRANPMAFLITSMRSCLIYEGHPEDGLLLIWLGAGLLISVLGIRKIYKNENSYVKMI